MPDAPDIRPPNDLEKAEKREFRRIIAARKALGRPVVAAELNTLIDYVRTRQRLALLGMIAERERKAAGTRSYPIAFMQVVRAIETATTTSRRLAHDLGLLETPLPKFASGAKGGTPLVPAPTPTNFAGPAVGRR